ncbi:MAG: choice-of-anchor J domain-containing protein, partial [Prevotella sp.]|nr:choice-of-anchor J domain-containing protein [Prevotella sp.]
IGIMSSPTDANTFVQIEEINVSNTYNNGFQEFTVPFSAYTGNGRYIAFMCGTGNAYAYFLIDDITVEVVPTCLIPMNLEATVNSETETILNWTAGGDETEWELEVTSEGSNYTQTAIVSGNSTYTLTTTRATTYSARVRANCGDGDYSDWTEYITFTSDCGITPVDANNPFFEDFENVGASDFPPTCWEKFSHEMTGYTYWYLNSNNDLNSSAAFSYWNEGYAFLVMPKMHIDGDANLSFDYLIGSGDYDESCSVVVSTGEMTYDDFTQTIWAADGDNLPSGRASATVSLSDYDGQDIYVAFKFKGSGIGGCSWYIDNIHIFVPVSQTIELSQGWNWWSTNLNITLEELKAAIATVVGTDSFATIKSQNGAITYRNGQWRGSGIETLDIKQMYEIQTGESCEIMLTGAQVNPADYEITMHNGNNWIGYLSNVSMTLDEAFGTFPVEGDVVKSRDQSSVFRNGLWRGQLNGLEPGKGYIYQSIASEDKPFTFPTNAK